MGTLNKAQLLRKEELKVELVELGNDESIFVREMTGRERDRFEASLIKEKLNKKGDVIGYDKALDDFRAKLAVCTMCDAEGSLVLESKDAGTLSENMRAFKLEKIVSVAQRLNAISEKDKEDLVKNSEPDPGDNSSSGSVGN